MADNTRWCTVKYLPALNNQHVINNNSHNSAKNNDIPTKIATMEQLHI